MSIGRSFGPSDHAPEKRRNGNKQQRRPSRPLRPSAAVPTVAVDFPIGPDEVRRIASKGYPLWESLDAMQLRNRRVTAAYGDLSLRLATVLAGGPDGRLETNWCTFSCWSSRTIGTWIDDDAVPEPLRQVKRLPRFVVRWLVVASQRLVQRSNGSSYRCLAAGNRFVFLEIGFAVSVFLDAFEGVDRTKPDEAEWENYWAQVRGLLDELTRLDPSWLLTDSPPPAELELGMRQYYEALFETDPKKRAELILAGNILVSAYEQRRVDGYVCAALALFTERSMRNLVRQRSGVVTGWLHRWPSKLFSLLMTRGLVLNTIDEQFKVAQPLPPPPGAATLFPEDLTTITYPLLQALLTRYDLSDGTAEGCRVRDWTSFDERMNYITNLFRSRQQHGVLFSPPFPADVEAALLLGRLDSAETGD